MKRLSSARSSGFGNQSGFRQFAAVASHLLIASPGLCSAADDAKVIAMSDWSSPVATAAGHSLRVRMIVAYGRGPAFAGPVDETQFFLEFHNVSGAIASPTQFYFDPAQGLRCEMHDANGRAHASSGAGSGGGPGATWITLPYDSTIRLRANMYGYGNKPGEGLNLMLFPPHQSWQIKAGDANAYYLSGTFTVKTPEDFAPKDFESGRAVWSGKLELQKMKISGAKQAAQNP